jgi:hypothetical protein
MIPEKLKIKVLKQDFKHAEFMHAQDCPIARAIVRDLAIAPLDELFGVGGTYVRFFRGEDKIEYNLPDTKSLEVMYILKGTKPERNISITLTLSKP